MSGVTFKPCNAPSGFSLLEILIVLGIIGIFIGISTITFSTTYHKNQRQITIEEIKQAIHYAKIQALASSKIMKLVPKTGIEWSKGMQLIQITLTGEVLIREWDWGKRNIIVKWKGFTSNNALQITPTLEARAASGRFVIQEPNGQTSILIVNRLARVREASQMNSIAMRYQSLK